MLATRLEHGLDTKGEVVEFPWYTAPFGIVSWLDMEQFSARAFYLIGVSLEALQTELLNAALTRSGHLVNPACFDAVIDDASREKAMQGLDGVDEAIQKIKG